MRFEDCSDRSGTSVQMHCSGATQCIMHMCTVQYFASCCQCHLRLHGLDASLAATRLPQGTGVLVSFLSAEQEGVRFAAVQALQAMLHTCLDAKVSPITSYAWPPQELPVCCTCLAITAGSLWPSNQCVDPLTH